MPTISEYARARGVSHQYISRLVKRGMPLGSFEAADLWREAHASSKPATNPTRIARMLQEENSSDSSAAQPQQELLNQTPNDCAPPAGRNLERAVMNAQRAAD